ncbi:potassium voltage-gated channel subfamily C member 1 [Elysia marginata]|uniref:Potassium voltage-gated channel subfamily C member 1 n=1 Tax=Elysia marginata TaxID=1093978 RepID=A0AAV4HEL7_9GAST|nr:potassium voltage-gated channel subfamily C member 1 [Elysia marginata]
MSRSLSLAPKISLAPGAKANNRVTLNVGGIRYQTNKSTLRAIPDTRLAWVTDTTASNPDYDPSTGEYFFDRHPGMFNMILNYYRTGKLHAPTDVCGPSFEEELAFWGIDEKQIEPCCWPNYRAHRDAQETLADFDNDNDDDDDDDGYDEDEIARRFGIVNEATKTEKSWFERWRPRIWTLLEEPYSSRAATIVTMCTSLFVILSVATYCAETHTLFRYTKNNTSLPPMLTVRETQRLTEPYLFMVVLEGACMAFFTIDIIVRIIFSPNKKEHLLQAQTFFDVMSVLPFYIRSLVVAIDPDSSTSDGLYFLNSLRLILIFRILKLTRYFSGFKILGHTLKASAKELLLMILVLSIGVLVFSCLIYYAEQLEEDSLNDFRNIPRGFWWAVVTMTTLGYGDMYPRTALGYIVGAVCALCGLLMLALPVPVIVSNFTLYYTHAQAKMKLPKKTRNTLVGAADALKASMSDLESQVASTRDSLSSVTSFDSKPGGSPRTMNMGGQSQQKQEEMSSGTLRKSVENTGEDCSVDSGFKAWSPHEERNTSGISVIFTDETRSPDLPRCSVSPRRGGNLRASAKRQRLSLCGPHRVTKITINSGRDKAERRATETNSDGKPPDGVGDKSGTDVGNENGDYRHMLTVGDSDCGDVDYNGGEGVGLGDGVVEGGNGRSGERIAGVNTSLLEVGTGRRTKELILNESGGMGWEGGGSGKVDFRETPEQRIRRRHLETSDCSEEEEETNDKNFSQDRSFGTSKNLQIDYRRSVSVPVGDSKNSPAQGNTIKFCVQSSTGSRSSLSSPRPPDHSTKGHNSDCLHHHHLDGNTQTSDLLPSAMQNGVASGVSRQSNVFYNSFSLICCLAVA